jgi:internalin A
MADKLTILIEQAAKEGWLDLNLSDNQLTSLPPEIVKLTNLTSLDLSRNQLTSLPPEIAKLSNLINLDLRRNQLTILPLEISRLTKLTYLDLGSNQLTILPPEIARLTKLTRLDLRRNHLTSLPPEIGSLTNLIRLDLWSNQLTSLPPEITRLSNLANLDLSDNPLTSLPPEIAKLTSLTSLNLSDNPLTGLLPEIISLTKLTSLDLSRNQLTSLPPEIISLTNLTSLDLSKNHLTSLPPEIARLTNLTNLDLSRNHLPIPPETLDNSNEVKAIFAALAGLVSGERLNEAKMLVVGNPEVGKSSVVEQLLYGTFNPKKETTLGVEINDEMKVVQSEVEDEGEPVKLNIWDFGGQEIQHSTHQFFLTTRSLYLLVVNARKGDQLSNIEYWLKLLESSGGASPIIIVINQTDQLKGQRPLNLDRKALQDKYNIRDFVETSCATGEGIPALKAAIAREVGQLKHVHDIWPREWLAIKQRLKDLHADYIPVEKYLEICGEENLNDEDLRQSLLGLLNDLGVAILFPGDTQVLNPRWVTRGVYGLLTSAQLVKDQGQFDLKNVGEILAGVVPDAHVHYPSHSHERLIKVMQRFQLCFEFTDRPGHYLIPRHLHDNELDILWDETEALKFQYYYVETLPDFIISRFIVRMNQYITQQYYWKNGVFLHSGENRAKIKADLVDRKIFISIIGKEQTRRAFLAVIRSAFDEINSNFKIEIKQMIPLPDYPAVLVSYDELIVYENNNRPTYFVANRGVEKDYEVRYLLDGVEELHTRMERRESDLNEVRFLRIVVASPADVQPERDVLPSVIDDVNRQVANDRRLHLVLSRWETDTHPGFHPEGPQGLIDPILKITDCDLLVGIFWKRFGTPTADGKTGTEHEFGLAYEAWREERSPQIFIYFNQKPYKPELKTDIEQWGKVLEFRDKFPKEGLWWPYKGKVQFERLVRNHLMNYIRSLTNFSTVETG